MWTLSDARDRLGGRLGEVSTTFWSVGDRNDAINDAQRFIAALTRGVPHTWTGTVNAATPYVDLPGKVIGMHGSAGRIANGAALSMVPINEADAGFPNWRTYAGTPKWVVVDLSDRRAYITPIPATDTDIEVVTSILPDSATSDATELFSGVPIMEKYLGGLLNLAASFCLLRERYDGDAERFYQFATQELQAVGIDPTTIPAYRDVAQAAKPSGSP